MEYKHPQLSSSHGGGGGGGVVAKSCLALATPWTTAACQAPLSMGFSRQEYWSGLPFPSPPPLMSTTKSKLPAEQLLMKKIGIYQKRSSTTRDIRKEPQQDGQEGWTHNIIKFHTPEWVTQQTGEQLYCIVSSVTYKWLGSSDGKESACNTGDLDLIPEAKRSPGEENGYQLKYSCLENSMDRRAWKITVHNIAKSQIQLSD